MGTEAKVYRYSLEYSGGDQGHRAMFLDPEGDWVPHDKLAEVERERDEAIEATKLVGDLEREAVGNRNRAEREESARLHWKARADAAEAEANKLRNGFNKVQSRADRAEAKLREIREAAVGTLNQAADQLELLAGGEWKGRHADTFNEEEISRILGLRSGFRSLAEDFAAIDSISTEEEGERG